ncbi:hypothetical protein [Salinilacihabitans rarus]|uniref:hypothetical protein n=1 Tax=Salinilacihabitans rarus TaxID=2961596 RepID=UPI0020C8F6A7|nr:hypothetical protein [Salinilacihabitans rarus]
MSVEFDSTTAPSSLEVYDRIEQRRLRVRTSKPVSPAAIAPERFCFPVDSACSIETASLVFDQRYSVHLHDENGQSIRDVDVGERVSLDGTRFVGLGGPIKLYCRVPGAGEIETGIDSIHLTFERETTIDVGARSLHERPTATVRTPADPEATMRALSALSSALKTTSPERSWPSLRGHPPLIELGDDLEIPPVVTPLETPITIRVPPTYRDLYAVASLSFYLGADVRPGDRPAIETATATHELGVDRPLADDAARALKRLFLLDCVVRTEGVYPDPLHERSRLEDVLPFDPGRVYDATLSERVDRYLDVPYEVVEPYVPRWPLTAHVPSTPDGIEILPFVVNELGVVREPRGEVVRAPAPAADAEATFVRSASVERSPSVRPVEEREPKTYVEPAVDDGSIEQAWFGEDVPRGASKATLEAYRNQLSRGRRNESIEILVVCNDARMLEEHDLLGAAYGNREALPFDVDSEFGVATDELAALLDRGYDFLHYIGHATPDGLRCSDGELDVRSLSSVDLGVFFLNACRSYDQGLALTRRGAFGGIATLQDVGNEDAVEVGETMARLLNLGFPLRAALELVRETTALGDEYLIVGDGSADIAQTDGGAPTAMWIENDEEPYDAVIKSYPTKELAIGSATKPNIETITERHLTSGTVRNSSIPRSELLAYLTWARLPVCKNGSIIWNDSPGLPDLP